MFWDDYYHELDFAKSELGRLRGLNVTLPQDGINFTLREIRDFAFSRYCSSYSQQERCRSAWFNEAYAGTWHNTSKHEDTIFYQTVPEGCNPPNYTECTNADKPPFYKKCIWSVNQTRCFGANPSKRDNRGGGGTFLDPRIPEDENGLPDDYFLDDHYLYEHEHKVAAPFAGVPLNLEFIHPFQSQYELEHYSYYNSSHSPSTSWSIGAVFCAAQTDQ
jgi:hypothetical protein